jgi:hypothetical protein
VLYQRSLLWGGSIGLLGGLVLGVLLWALWFLGQGRRIGDTVSTILGYTAVTAFACTLAGALTGVLTCYLLHGYPHSPFLPLAGAITGAASDIILGAVIGFFATLITCLILKMNGQSPIAGLLVGAVCALINCGLGIAIGLLVVREIGRT